MNEKNAFINEKIIFNSDSEINEIFKSKDLEQYLILKKNVKFDKQDELKRIDMKFNENKIGFIYNINDFEIENYWKRSEEIYIKLYLSSNDLTELIILRQ